MNEPNHVSLALQNLLDTLAGSLATCDPLDRGQMEVVLKRLFELKAQVEREKQEQLAPLVGFAIKLTEEVSNHGLAGPTELIEIVQGMVERVRNELGARAWLPTDTEEPGAATPASVKDELRMIEGGMLGEILVKLSMLDSEAVERALKKQRSSGMMLGEALVELGVVSKEGVQAALRIQESRRRHSKGLDTWSHSLR